MKVLLDVFYKFPEFNAAKDFYTKKVHFLNKQKLFFKNKDVKWINNFTNVKEGPVIFLK